MRVVRSSKSIVNFYLAVLLARQEPIDTGVPGTRQPEHMTKTLLGPSQWALPDTPHSLSPESEDPPVAPMPPILPIPPTPPKRTGD